MKKIFTTATIKNESDIIESYCRYNLTWCDGMLIRENGSSDNTKAIIQNLIDEGLSIYFIDGKDQTERARQAIDEYGADLVIPLDADAIYGPDTAIWKIEKKAKGYSERLELARKMYGEALSHIDKNTVCLSVGGDVFCYNNWHRLAVFQEKAADAGAKTILWGCSIEPSAITPEMLEVLRSYTAIAARESITYDALYGHGLGDRLVLAPDSAFALQPSQSSLPGNMLSENTIGINISPLVIRRETSPGILMENIRNMIKYIISQTTYNIMLIPHVVMPADNDFAVLSELYGELSEVEKQRVYLVDEHRSAQEYKYIISQCALLVCARTHASIAAYSLGLPAMVLGYSVKARGIGRDLGIDDYVLDLAQITEVSALTNVILRLLSELDGVRGRLAGCLPEYLASLDKLASVI